MSDKPVESLQDFNRRVAYVAHRAGVSREAAMLAVFAVSPQLASKAGQTVPSADSLPTTDIVGQYRKGLADSIQARTEDYTAKFGRSPEGTALLNIRARAVRDVGHMEALYHRTFNEARTAAQHAESCTQKKDPGYLSFCERHESQQADVA